MDDCLCTIVYYLSSIIYRLLSIVYRLHNGVNNSFDGRWTMLLLDTEQVDEYKETSRGGDWRWAGAKLCPWR